MTKKNAMDPKEMEKVSGGMIIDPLNPPRTPDPPGGLASIPVTGIPDNRMGIIK